MNKHKNLSFLLLFLSVCVAVSLLCSFYARLIFSNAPTFSPLLFVLSPFDGVLDDQSMGKFQILLGYLLLYITPLLFTGVMLNGYTKGYLYMVFPRTKSIGKFLFSLCTRLFFYVFCYVAIAFLVQYIVCRMQCTVAFSAREWGLVILSFFGFLLYVLCGVMVIVFFSLCLKKPVLSLVLCSLLLLLCVLPPFYTFQYFPAFYGMAFRLSPIRAYIAQALSLNLSNGISPLPLFVGEIVWIVVLFILSKCKMERKE